MLARPVAVLVMAALLAGCSDEAPADLDPATPGTQSEAAPEFTVDAPSWQVGDWWTHDWAFVGANAPVFTVKSIVSGNASGTYTFSAADEATAAQHGAFFFMDLGTMGQDGVMRAGDFAFPWVQFPLSDNKTWTAAERNLGGSFETVDRQLTMTARLMGEGDARHFAIEAREGGALYAEYDYQPELGWFSQFSSYRPDENGTPQVLYTITTSGSGQGYTGPVFDAAGTMLVNEQPLIHPGSSSAPAAVVPFTPEAGVTHVFAILFSFGAGGGHHTQMLAPDGQHWEATGAGDADGNPVGPPGVASGAQVLTPSQAGQWTVAFAGGGVVAGGGAFVWGVTITPGTL